MLQFVCQVNLSPSAPRTARRMSHGEAAAVSVWALGLGPGASFIKTVSKQCKTAATKCFA